MNNFCANQISSVVILPESKSSATASSSTISKCKPTRSARARAKKLKRPVEPSRCVKGAELEKTKQTLVRLKRRQRPRSRQISRGLRKRNRATRKVNDFGVPK